MSAATSRSMIAIAGPQVAFPRILRALAERLPRRAPRIPALPLRAALMPMANSSLALPKLLSVASSVQFAVSIT